MLHNISDLAELYKIYCIIQYKCKVYLVKYSNGNAQSNHNTNVIPITWLYNMLRVMILGVPSHWDGMHGLKPAEAHCSLKFFC